MVIFGCFTLMSHTLWTGLILLVRKIHIYTYYYSGLDKFTMVCNFILGVTLSLLEVFP